MIVLRKRNGSVLTQKSGFCKELKIACWRVYIRSKAIFIKEFPEAGWVRRVGLPSRNFLTYVTDCQGETPSIEDCGLRV